METELIIAIFTSSIAAIASVTCAWLANRSGKDAKSYRSKREQLDKAKWKVLTATMSGVSLLLHHAHGEELNGNVEAALKKIDEANKELDDVNSDIISKV